jgi:hypothetical protein
MLNRFMDKTMLACRVVHTVTAAVVMFALIAVPTIITKNQTTFDDLISSANGGRLASLEVAEAKLMVAVGLIVALQLVVTVPALKWEKVVCEYLTDIPLAVLLVSDCATILWVIFAGVYAFGLPFTVRMLSTFVVWIDCLIEWSIDDRREARADDTILSTIRVSQTAFDGLDRQSHGNTLFFNTCLTIHVLSALDYVFQFIMSVTYATTESGMIMGVVSLIAALQLIGTALALVMTARRHYKDIDEIRSGLIENIRAWLPLLLASDCVTIVLCACAGVFAKGLITIVIIPTFVVWADQLVRWTSNVDLRAYIRYLIPLPPPAAPLPEAQEQ